MIEFGRRFPQSNFSIERARCEQIGVPKWRQSRDPKLIRQRTVVRIIFMSVEQIEERPTFRNRPERDRTETKKKKNDSFEKRNEFVR